MSDPKNAKTWSIFWGSLPWMADLANEGGAEGANTMFATVAPKPAAAAQKTLFSLSRQGFF